jgi:DNA-binding MarR family transcriptional regulator
MNSFQNFHPVRLRRVVMTWTHHVEFFTRAAYGFEMPESRLLWLLGLGGPTTASQLTGPAFMQKFQISRAIAKLRKLGYVTAQPHPDDLRSEILELTAKGKACYEQLAELSIKWANATEQQLTPREQLALDAMLAKLQAGVEALGPVVAADLARIKPSAVKAAARAAKKKQRGGGEQLPRSMHVR